MLPREAFAGGSAVITGAGSGIGEALAHAVAALDVSVVVAEISEERGEKVASDIRKAGGDASFFRTDVRDAEAMRALADYAYGLHGDVRLLVNNAGISVMGLIWEIADADWERSIDINFNGVLNGIRAFAPRMLASPRQAYLCNVASLASFSMDQSVAPYFTTKHAVLSLSECLHIEMQSQPNPVAVSVAVPGFIATRIFSDSALANAACEPQRELMEAAVRNMGMSAAEGAAIILDGIAEGRFIISTHPEMTQGLANSRGEYLRTLGIPRPSGDAILSDLR